MVIESTAVSSRPILVAGMHRSGTSMVAGLLRQAGVWMGDDLLEAGEGNAFGHFENKQILEFHRELLARRKEPRALDFDDGTLRSERFVFNPTKRELSRAKALLKKLERPGLWGWKDPRTALFLKFWLECLKEAVVVVPFRHPLDVYCSFLRRANNLDMACMPALFFDSYVVYNKAILETSKDYPERFLFVEAPVVADKPDLFLDEVSALVGSDLKKCSNSADFVHRDALAGGTVSKNRHEMLKSVFTEVTEIYEELAAKASPHFVQVLVAENSDIQTSEKAHCLMQASEMISLGDRGCLVPLIEQWALGLPSQTLRSKRNLILSRIQQEISERERVIGEMKCYIEPIPGLLIACISTA